MENLKFNEIKFKNEELKKTAELLINNGFNVYTSITSFNKITSYIYFEENNKIGCLQAEYSGVKYSSVHLGGQIFGTGFGLCEYPLVNLTIEELRKAFIFAPHWAVGDTSKIVKYKGMKDYIKQNTILKYIQIIESF